MRLGGVIREPKVQPTKVVHPETAKVVAGTVVSIRQQRRRSDPLNSEPGIPDVLVGTFAGSVDLVHNEVEEFLNNKFEDDAYPANEERFAEQHIAPLRQWLAAREFPEAQLV